MIATDIAFDKSSPFSKPPEITVTYKEILEAIEKNGLDHLRGSWFSHDSGGIIIAGCVLGQGAFNLKAQTDSIEEALNNIRIPRSKVPAKIRGHFGKDTNVGLGQILIEMNDNYTDDFMYTYSWKQLVSYATTHLKPHFEKTATLNRDYSM